MNLKWVKFTPLILIAAGAALNLNDPDGNEVAFRIGQGIGLYVFGALPALLFATLHWALNRKSKQEEEVDDELLDVNGPIEKPKFSWYILFCCYTLGFGILGMIFALMGSN